MPRSPIARRLGLIAALLSNGGGMASVPAFAQPAPTTTLEIPLHTAYLGIRTTALGRPEVRVVDAHGAERIRVQPPGARPADGHWLVSLATGPNAIEYPPVLLRPGDQVSVRIDGRETRAVVPDMTATADARTDTVTGRLPEGVAAGLVLAQRDPELFGVLPAPPGVAVLAGPGGAVTASLGDRIDLRPGTFGQLICLGPDGHVFAVSFAVPIALISGASYTALVRADANTRAALALLDQDGSELARSGIAVELGGGLSLIGLAQGGDVVSGLFAPRPGQRVALLIDEIVVASAPVPLVTAVVDRAAREVRGQAPAGSRVALQVRAGAGSDTPSATTVVTATADGAFAAPVALDLAHDASTEASAWPGNAFRWLVTGSVPHVQVALWGDAVSGVAEARGEVRVRYRSADGAVTALAIGETGSDGAFSVRLPSRGDIVAVAPGDALALDVGGAPLAELAVPGLVVAPDAARRSIAGSAPAGAELRASAYAAEPNAFSVVPYQEPSDALRGRAAEDGAFALACERPECRTRYGLLTADTGPARYVLHWLDAPIYGLGVTAAAAVGRATAGTAVTIAPLGDDGAPGAVVATVARPSPDGALPGFSLELQGAFPEGLAEGTRLQVTIAGVARTLEVPRFAWAADVVADVLRGEGPPLQPIIAVALATGGGPERLASAQRSALVGLDGRWELPLRPFDLRAADELYLFLLADGYYLEWRDHSVVGPDEPTEPPPTPPVPEPTPGPAPPWRAFLPVGWAGGGG